MSSPNAGAAASTRAPHCSDNDLVFVEGEVEMARYLWKVDPTQARNACLPVGRARTGKQLQNSKGVFELRGEHVDVRPVLKPPGLLARDMFPRGGCEQDAPALQDALSSFRISSASTSRPAATSASDSRRALCRAARSVSSSQSPGSSASSSISVPSGRSVGSSTTSRPARTRAFRVMRRTVALAGPPNKARHPSAAAARLRSTASRQRGCGRRG